MKESIQNILLFILIFIVCFCSVAIFIWVGIDTHKRQKENYNNGICTLCGEEFHFAGIDRGDYYWACENDHVIEYNPNN